MIALTKKQIKSVIADSLDSLTADFDLYQNRKIVILTGTELSEMTNFPAEKALRVSLDTAKENIQAVIPQSKYIIKPDDTYVLVIEDDSQVIAELPFGSNTIRALCSLLIKQPTKNKPTTEDEINKLINLNEEFQYRIVTYMAKNLYCDLPNVTNKENEKTVRQLISTISFSVDEKNSFDVVMSFELNIDNLPKDLKTAILDPNQTKTSYDKLSPIPLLLLHYDNQKQTVEILTHLTD